MDKIKLIISVMLLILAGCMFQSCGDEPEESEVLHSTINRGEYFTANMGTLTFRIVNNYPFILPSEGLSNYVEAPLIAYLGEFNSLDEISLPSDVNWQKQCRIEDKSGYVAKVKWYDPSSRKDRRGYIYMFVEKIGDSHIDPRPGVFHDEIRVTYKVKA